ncbi:hypothetical protein [Halobacteriovorax sp. JY17]|uniref:hypothetical protein n=1 Tax=Halobacteriovorax sp. JY17 TaxID=2014617 RepID=UPI000C644125|nr:hypothetical protein [Halobacteriovorax sp. JY17]PIK13540.1 MAG: hypothetical protein CES88_15225 [Halobacteriovorax sp. JY17]
MNLKKISIFTFFAIITSCGLIKKTTVKQHSLEEFIHLSSAHRCQEVTTEKKMISVLTSTKRKEIIPYFKKAEKLGANYFIQNAKNKRNRIDLSTYKCNFENKELVAGADSVYLFSSDHIIVNCKIVKSISDSFYHDDYKYIHNHYRNLGVKSGGNVINLESTASGKFVLGIYSCNPKSLAQSKIDIRKEYREKEANWLKFRENEINHVNSLNVTSALRDISYSINKLNYNGY